MVFIFQTISRIIEICRNMFGFLRKLLGPKVDIEQKLRDGAIVVDVRTIGEYNGGHVKGSKHIPLDNVGDNISEIQNWDKPIITCCASGMRSASAASKLRKNGIEAYNGGPWQKVDKLLKK